MPLPILNRHIEMIPVLQAEEALAEFEVAAIAHPEYPHGERQKTLAGWAKLARRGDGTVDGKRPDGTWEIKSGADLRRFFVVEGGFGQEEVG